MIVRNENDDRLMCLRSAIPRKSPWLARRRRRAVDLVFPTRRSVPPLRAAEESHHLRPGRQGCRRDDLLRRQPRRSQASLRYPTRRADELPLPLVAPLPKIVVVTVLSHGARLPNDQVLTDFIRGPAPARSATMT